MSQQRTSAVVSALVVVALVGGGGWYLMRDPGVDGGPKPEIPAPAVRGPAPAPAPVVGLPSVPKEATIPVPKTAYDPTSDPRNARDELTISGVVTTSDASPVEGALVEILLDTSAVVSRAQEGEVRGSMPTIANGSFYFSAATCPSCGLSFNERYVLRVSHPNYATERVIGVEARAQHRNIVLASFVNRVAGTIRDRDGAPLGDATISVYDLSAGAVDPDGAIERTGRSNADGTYVVTNLKPGLKKIWVTRPGFASTGRPTQNVEAAIPEIRADFSLRPGSSISGLIASQETGLGIEGAFVTLKPTRFAISKDVVAAGKKNARGEKGEQTPTTDKKAWIENGGGATPEERVKAAKDERKRRMEEHVKAGGATPPREDGGDEATEDQDPTGEPRAGRMTPQEANLLQQTMHLTTLSFRSRADGTFVAEGLEEGVYQVTVNAPGFAPPPIQSVESGAKDVAFSLMPNARILGRCVDDETGRPVASFTVGLGSSFDQNSVPHHLRRSFGPPKFPDGTFEYQDVRPGTYFLIAEAAGYAGGRSESVTVGQAEKREGVVIRLVKGATITGRVVDSTGRPVGDATVSVDNAVASDPANIFSTMIFSQLRRDVKSARTASDGTYKIENVLDGKFAMKVRHPDYGPYDDLGSFDVPKGGAVERPEITLRRGAAVRGRVLTKDGQPDAQAMVQIAPIGGSSFNQRQAATDSDGRFEVTGLTPGEYQIILAQRGGQIDLAALLGTAALNAQRTSGTAPNPGLPLPKTYQLIEGQTLTVDF